MTVQAPSVAPAPAVQVWTDRGDEKGVKISAAAPVTPQARRYVEFTKTCYVLKTKQPERLEELRKHLVEEGIWKELDVEIAGDQIRFHHGLVELEDLANLALKKPKLRPYFWSSKSSVFCNPSYHFPSDMGLVGSVTSFAKNKELSRSLVEQARLHFQSQAAPLPAEFTFQAKAADAENLKAVYQKFQGLCVGESHRDVNPKKFLLDNMETLRDLGVKTLFMEHFTYDTIQPLLDHYFDTPGADVPILLQAVLEAHADYYELKPPYTPLDILRKAKQCGIRIVGIDTSAARRIESGMGLTLDRELGMNFVAKTIIEREKGDGKYLALMGADHGSTQTWYEEGGSSRVRGIAPGVADLLQCPVIFIRDSSGPEKPPLINVANFKVYSNEYLYRKHVHLILERPKPVAPPVSAALTPTTKV